MNYFFTLNLFFSLIFNFHWFSHERLKIRCFCITERFIRLLNSVIHFRFIIDLFIKTGGLPVWVQVFIGVAFFQKTILFLKLEQISVWVILFRDLSSRNSTRNYGIFGFILRFFGKKWRERIISFWNQSHNIMQSMSFKICHIGDGFYWRKI